MNVHKPCQLKDIPTKIIKRNSDIFANFICLHFNYCIGIGEFLQEFKNADKNLHTNFTIYKLCIKRKKKVTKLITDL